MPSKFHAQSFAENICTNMFKVITTGFINVFHVSEKTKGYLESYEEVNRCFVKTRFLQETKTKLKRNAIAVLIGHQGSGKTSIAVNIMNDPDYKNWKKLKITSCEELLALSKTENDTLIYIDNLFDGFLYHRKLQDWWNSLCYFYFECIQPRETIHLLITAKEEEIKSSCSFIFADKNTPVNICFVREESYPLTYDEKKEILERQINHAKGKTKIDTSFDIDELVSKTEGKKLLIGFPLCAHMYALEEDQTLRDSTIFTNPRSYVRKQIHYKIAADDTNVVKTLLLTLLFTNNQNCSVDLKYGDSCKKFVEKQTSKEFIVKMQPLNFHEMHSKAEALQDEILIKNHNVFELKHQIYVEGICDYFFRTHFDAVVQYFPLDILRNCEMHDVRYDQLETVKNRIKTEIKNQALSEVFSWKIFENLNFEQYICEKLREEEKLMRHLIFSSDKSSGYIFPALFWTSKYKLPKLSKMIMKYAEYNKQDHQQFYLARFGECCAKNENYITCASNQLEVNNLQRCVFKFKTSDGETILHLLLLSGMPDYDAHHCVTKIFRESNNFDLKVYQSLLPCSLRQRKCSRLLCILEILKLLPRKQISLIEDENHADSLVNIIQTASSSKKLHLELEYLCRICIFVVYGVIPFSKSLADVFFNHANASRDNYPQRVNDNTQRKMAIRIEKCCHCLEISDLPVDAKMPDIIKSINPKLVGALKASIKILSKKDAI